MKLKQLLPALCVLCLPGLGPAYIDSPPESLTLPKLVLEFRSISILRVDKLDLGKGAILFRSVERLQGKEWSDVVKHAVKFDGGVPAELKEVKVGQLAVFFSGDGYGRGITLINGAWYCCSHDSRSGWWHIAYTASHYDFNCAFTGTVAELADIIRKLLRGEDAVMRCRVKRQTTQTQWVRCSIRQPGRKEVVAEPKSAPQVKTARPTPPVPTLLQALQDASAPRRVEAAEALAELGPAAKSATMTLATALRQDKDPFVRRAAAVALGQIGPEARAALPNLLACLQNQYENVDGLIGAEAAIAIGKIDPDGEALAPLLTAKLTHPDANTRMRAADWAAMIGPPARSVLPVLIEASRDKDGEVRHSAVTALGSIGADVKVAVPLFVAALKDPNKFVRMAAARALGNIGPQAKEAVPALRVATKDEDGEVRQYAQQALQQIGSP